jgi:lysophospholipase L1-like esterase
MRSYFKLFMTIIFLAVLSLANAATTQPSERPPRADGKLIAPGPLAKAADARRIFFDYWNEEIIRQGARVSTVFMGDSITELWDVNAYFQPPAGEIQANRGISADMAYIMVKRFEADVMQLHPRNVVILAGTNDVDDVSKRKNTDEQVIASIVASCTGMIDQAQAAGINVFLCSILPTNNAYVWHATRPGVRVRVNEQLRELCRTRGCIYVDYHSAMTDEKGDLRTDVSSDGIHANFAGLRVMADRLKAAAAEHHIQL